MHILKIAVVEDHHDLRDLFVDCLCALGHDAAGLDNADELDDHLVDRSLDLLILDLNLPGEDGFSIAQRLRAAHPALHIIMLTARNSVSDRIKGYSAGADLYLAKPVSPDELGAVVGSVARREGAIRALLPGVTLDTHRLTLQCAGGTLDLSRGEAVLLKSLAEAPGGKLEYWRLLELLELDGSDNGKGALEVRISRLKKKLQDNGIHAGIKSLWKEGYQLCFPLQITP